MRETLWVINENTTRWSRPFWWLMATVCYVMALFIFWRDCAKESKEEEKNFSNNTRILKDILKNSVFLF